MSDRPAESLAIIREVHCGVSDRGTACLWFSAYIGESSAALQVMSWSDAKDIIEAYAVTDVADLNGKPCWVDTSSHGIIRYLRPAKT